MKHRLASLSIKPFLLAFALLSAIAVFTKYQLSDVSTPPDSIPENEFSGERAMSMLRQLTPEQQPHPVDSTANREVETRLISLIRSMGYQEEIQDTEICDDWRGGVVRCTRVRNVIVEVKGREVGKGILLSAHYDSVPAGPGGSDAGAAVGTLLESMRLLSLQSRPRNSVVFLFNEGEEFGLFGAKAFMAQHPLATELQLALNIEARGSGGKSVMFETGEDSGWLVDHYAQSTLAPVSSSLFYEVYKYLPNDTDLTEFKKFGLQGLNFAHAEREPHYHTPLDNLDNLAVGTIQYHGDNVWGVLSQIKDIDLTQVETGNRVFSDVLGLFVIRWSESHSFWFSLLLLVSIIIISIRLVNQDILTNGALVKSTLTLLVTIISSGLLAWVIQLLAENLGVSSTPWRSDLLPMRVSIWLGVLAIGLICGTWLMRSCSPIARATALVWLWVLLALASSCGMPGVSFLFILPALVGVVVIGFLALKSQLKGPADVRIAKLGLVILALVAAMSFMPIAHVLEVMVSYQMAVAIGLVLGFVVCALLPLLGLKTSGRVQLNRLAFSFLLLAGIALFWTVIQPAYTQWMPQPMNVLYVQKSDNEAQLLAGRQQKQLPKSLSDALGKTVKAQSLFWSRATYHQAPVSSLQLKPAEISTTTVKDLESTDVSETSRKVRVQVSTSSSKLADIRLYLPKDAGLVTIESDVGVFNYQGEYAGRNGYYEYHCRGASCSDTELILHFDHQKKVKLTVVKAMYGLPGELGHLMDKRGEAAIQRQAGDQTLIFKDYEI